jgi:hypothetical protein
MALGSTQPPIRWVPGPVSLGVKRPEREADHSPPSSAEVKGCLVLYLHSSIRLHGVVINLKKEAQGLCHYYYYYYYHHHHHHHHQCGNYK